MVLCGTAVMIAGLSFFFLGLFIRRLCHHVLRCPGRRQTLDERRVEAQGSNALWGCPVREDGNAPFHLRSQRLAVLLR